MPIPDVVKCFFSEAERTFGPWLRERNGRLLCDLTHVNRAGKLERTTPEHVYGFFSATADFETPRILGTLRFGDRELGIDADATPQGRPERHGLWEWANAVDRPDLVPHNTIFVTQFDRMAELIGQFASATRELESVIAEASPDILRRMAAERADRQAAQEGEWKEAEHRGTVRVADDAFRQHDWRRVVTLLESIEDRLTPAEAAKLDYARKRAES